MVLVLEVFENNIRIVLCFDWTGTEVYYFVYFVVVDNALLASPEKKEVYVILEEDRNSFQQDLTTIPGPEMSKLLKIGTRVVRGIDWKWGDQVNLKSF